MTLEALKAELKALLASWEYAYAMGHGCSVGDHPQHRAVRRRAEDLRAQHRRAQRLTRRQIPAFTPPRGPA